MASSLASTPPDPSSGHWEGVQLTRRYKFFRPRQAAYGFVEKSATNRATCYLFNNSPNTYLVVRQLSAFAGSNTVAYVTVTYGNPGGTLGFAPQPFVADQGTPPGQTQSVDTTTAFTNYLNAFNLGNTFNTFINPTWPLHVLPINWALGLQLGTAGLFLHMSVLYESVLPDELDFFW